MFFPTVIHKPSCCAVESFIRVVGLHLLHITNSSQTDWTYQKDLVPEQR